MVAALERAGAHFRNEIVSGTLADPAVGLLSSAAIFVIVWQSARAVIVRMLDGVDPAPSANTSIYRTYCAFSG